MNGRCSLLISLILKVRSRIVSRRSWATFADQGQGQGQGQRPIEERVTEWNQSGEGRRPRWRAHFRASPGIGAKRLEAKSTARWKRKSAGSIGALPGRPLLINPKWADPLAVGRRSITRERAGERAVADCHPPSLSAPSQPLPADRSAKHKDSKCVK
jgi:hypothetical protein